MQSVRVFASSLRAPASSRAFASSTRSALRAAPAPRTPVVARHAFRRSYSTEAPKEGGSSALWLTLGAVVAAGGGYWYYTQSSDATTLAKSAKQTGKAAMGFTPKQGDYQQVYNKVAELLDEAGDYDGEWWMAY
jgi:cytochrome c peroxidase